MNVVALSFFAVLGAAYYTEEEAAKIFAQGNDAYANGQYEQAKEAYQRLVEAGLDSPDVLYNLGTTELALHDLGNAVLHLERAKRAGGKSEDIDANLAVARSQQLDQVVAGYFEKAFIQRIVEATSENWVSWAFIVSWVLAFGTLALNRLITEKSTLVSIFAALCFLVAVPSGFLLLGHVYVRETIQEAVVVSPTAAAAREFPKESLKPLFEIHPGLKVQVLEDSGNYVRIRLPNGLEGWTEKSGVAQI